MEPLLDLPYASVFQPRFSTRLFTTCDNRNVGKLAVANVLSPYHLDFNVKFA